MKPKKLVIISDVDGVLTDGSFYYDEHGKCMKRFGRDDSDALKILRKMIPDAEVKFCSSDFHGFNITKKRINDMGYGVEKVSVQDRPKWIKENFPKDEYYTVYIGDSFVDVPVFSVVDYSCTLWDSHKYAKSKADFTSPNRGGGGGFAECIIQIICMWLNKTYLEVLESYICHH